MTDTKKVSNRWKTWAMMICGLTHGVVPNQQIIPELLNSLVYHPMDGLDIPEPSRLHRRGIIFAHRDLDTVLQANSKGDDFGVLTGLMPSGKMHLGHSMVIEQVKWFQKMGGDVTHCGC